MRRQPRAHFGAEPCCGKHDARTRYTVSTKCYTPLDGASLGGAADLVPSCGTVRLVKAVTSVDFGLLARDPRPPHYHAIGQQFAEVGLNSLGDPARTSAAEPVRAERRSRGHAE